MDDVINPLPTLDLRSPAERVDDVALMVAQCRLAVREAIQAHKRAGNPIAVWRDEKVVWLQPHEIPDDDVLAR